MSRAIKKCKCCGQENWFLALRCNKCGTSFIKNNLLFLLLVIALLTSCINSKPKALRRVEKLANKFSLTWTTDTIIKIDTIKFNDTITIPEIKWDTVVKWNFNEPVVVEQDGIKTEITVMTDTLWLKNTVLKRDTIIELREVVKEKIKNNYIPKEVTKTWIPWWVYFTIGMLVSIVLYLFLTKSKK